MTGNDEEYGGYRNKHGPIPLKHMSNDQDYVSREELEARGHGPQLKELEEKFFRKKEQNTSLQEKEKSGDEDGTDSEG